MKIVIEINCETIGELTTHLYEIIKQAKKECRKQKLDPLHDEFESGLRIEDDNCYGDHLLRVFSDEPNSDKKAQECDATNVK